MKENILGTDKISKLIKKFSIPCIISLVVNALYNMVDQIFIGWGVGYLGNGATNVVFPLTIICLAFALMLGDGCSAFLSLKLGQKCEDEAKSGTISGIIMSVILSIVFFVVAFIFLPNIINIFGCTDALRSYALDYGKFIVMGLPFLIIGTTLNSIIRADGSPKYAMFSMVLGAILNIILDPIFIFVFKMGVKGAAIATALSQVATFIINVTYLWKFKSIHINKNDVKFNFKNFKSVFSLGISSFITQLSLVVVIAVLNNLLVKYGTKSKFGSEIPITVLGIVMKVNYIIQSIVIGIAAGSQPIFGYNYGASKNDRVKETLKIVLTLSFIVSLLALILFQVFPIQIISVFGSGNHLYNEFAKETFRIFLLFVGLNGIQIATSIFFQAIGQSTKSALLSLSRQVIFLVPISILFGHLFGVIGVLWAGAISDVLAFIISIILVINQSRKLVNTKSESIIEKNNVTKQNNILNQDVIITISREFGSGGRYVGQLLADKLGIKLYDKELINKVADESGFSEKYIEENEQNIKSTLSNYSLSNLGIADNLFMAESDVIKDISKKGSSVIIGRCADYILKDNKNVINIFIYNDEDAKIKRCTEYYGIKKNEAKRIIDKINKRRSSHYRYYTNQKWGYSTNYDLSINSDVLGIEKTVEIIESFVLNKYKK